MKIKVIKPKTETELKRKRVCAYVRVSTDSLEQEDSLDNQSAYFADYIRSNPAWEFAGIYADQGISGFKENRPQFQKMIADARAGKIDLIIVKSVSRFARNTETVLKFSRELKSIGVGIFFELQNINTLSGPGELMLTIIAAFAQAESQGASDNANLTYRRKFNAGIPTHDLKFTFGFDSDEGGNIYIIEEQARTVRLIFDLAQKGVWPSKIKQYLNKNNIPACSGGKWDDTASSGFLKILPTKATWFCKRPIWTQTVSAIRIMGRKTSGTLRRITLLLYRRSSGMRYRRSFWRAVKSLLRVHHRCPPSHVPAEISIRLRINYSALFAGRSSTTNGRIKARTNIGLAAQM